MNARALLVYVALLPLGGCASCFGEQIAEGVARLTVVSAGAVAIAARSDDVCGLASPNVATTVEGEVGGVGRVVRRIEACRIDLGTGTRLDEDCEGATLDASGVAVVTAEEITWGTLTGDPAQPVIPRDADAVTMHVDATLSSFTARMSEDPAELRIDGSLVVTLGVRLARAADSGVCAVPTDDVRFESIALDGDIRLDSGRGDPVVETSDVEARLSAFVGVHDEGSNRVRGTVTIFGETHPQDTPLEDAFDAMAHVRGYACDEALARPIQFDCASPFAEVAGGVARLSTAMVGALSAEVAARCFSDPSRFDVRYDVEVGRRGVATKTLRAGACVLRLEGSVGGADCLGAAPNMNGEVRVQGEQTIRGRTTGDPLRPAAPESSTAVAMKLELHPAGPVTFEAGRGAPPLDWTGGVVRAEVRPRMTTGEGGLCVVATPNVGMWVDAEQLAYTLRADVAFSGHAAIDVFAQSGRGASHENAIEGEVRTGDVAYRVDGALDPDYDRARVACAGPTDVACDLDARLAADVARALIAGAGHAAQLLADGVTCPDADSPALGDIGVDACDLDGYAGWDLLERDYDACRFDGEAELFTSCDGVTDWVAGRLDVEGNDFVRARLCVDIEGARDLADFIDAPHPRAPDVSRIVAEDVRLTDFVVGRSDANGALFEATIGGALELDVTPVFGERSGSRDRYDVPTPVARIDRARYGPSTITFAVDGLVLKYDVEADLSAAVGWFRGEGNRLAGRVVLDGVPYTIDEAFEAGLTVAAQDARYTCDPALAAPLD
ncbi:MAG: hypothetical protein RMA76_33695 [Deltaproteobacteria bacterium]